VKRRSAPPPDSACPSLRRAAILFVGISLSSGSVSWPGLVESMGKSSGARALRLSGPIVLLLLWQHVGQVVAQVCTKDGKLCDKHERCAAWKEDGECVRSRTYMRKHCPASCETVREEVKEAGIAADQGDCKDMHKHCSLWAKRKWTLYVPRRNTDCWLHSQYLTTNSNTLCLPQSENAARRMTC
jgi:ShK domain-like